MQLLQTQHEHGIIFPINSFLLHVHPSNIGSGREIIFNPPICLKWRTSKTKF